MTFREVSYHLSESGRLLSMLHEAATSDGANPKSFALLLRRVEETKAWLEVGYPTFTAYLKAPEPRGLGMNEDGFLRVAELGDEGVRARRLLYGGEDGKIAERGVNQHTGGPDNVRSSGYGNSESYTIRRLKRDRPDLAQAVINGHLSANAAAIQAGWRPRTLNVPVDDLQKLAAALRRHLDPDHLAALAALISDSTGRETP